MGIELKGQDNQQGECTRQAPCKQHRKSSHLRHLPGLGAPGFQPPGQGKITKVEWDFQGTGNFIAQPVQAVSPVEHLSNSYTYATPGTYFATVRVTAQRNGDTSTPYTLVQNLATVRVVVH